MHGNDDAGETDLPDFGLDKEMVDSTFLDLEMEPDTDDPIVLERRFQLICQVWAYVEHPYDFLKLAHFLERDPSIEAQELYDAALRTAWRKPSAEGDPWEDEWWYDAVDAISDQARAESLRQFARAYRRDLRNDGAG